ncbi:MAG: BLUF domain-containing protein [Cytophagales bacterium]|nr:MAG: BLUF domain-containing protein [Cytophagales bacterium]
MLTHLLYVSSRNANCTDAELDNILASCQKNNPISGTTGLLLYSDMKFVQYVEGEYSKLLPLYDKIKHDNRHSNVNLISIGMIEKRLFPNWHMGLKKASLKEIDYVSEMGKEDKAALENVFEGKTEQGKKVQKLLETLMR